MEVTWDDLGCPSAPGIAFSERWGVRVDVKVKDIKIWMDEPQARFRLIRYTTYEGNDPYLLGNRTD